MTRIPKNLDLKQMALNEYNSDVTTAHHGFVTGGNFWNGTYPDHNGKKSRPFWNVHATQFMFNPCFEFAAIPKCNRFLFTATDCNKKVHTFEANSPMSLLTPIWGELPEGYVELKVEALEDDGTLIAQVGSRCFWRCAPYGGPDAYPPKARGYRECALMAYRYIYNMPAIQHWLTTGKPDPEYRRYIYPSKMITAIISAMVSYASIEPENAENALQLAKNAADYLLSITVGEDSPLYELPPTYRYHFESENYEGETEFLEKTIMMCYPASVASSYLLLEKATGDVKYYEAAHRIADCYRNHVLENGTWPLLLEIATGNNCSVNDLNPETVIPFMEAMYDRTGEEIWLKLMKNAHAYRVDQKMESYEWEGQFEDSPTSAHYTNMSHYPADAMVYYITENEKDNPESIAQAEELMRFIEDQFVVWGNHAPRNRSNHVVFFFCRQTRQNGILLPVWNSTIGMCRLTPVLPILWEHSCVCIK